MGNDRLRTLLTEVGWRPETFAKRIAARARRLGFRVTVHEKTPYSWIRDGRCPHDPLPHIACDVLAEQLGRALTPSDLGWTPKPGGLVRADDGLADLWFAEGTILGLEEVSSGVHRRNFLALTGSALTAVALQAIVADTPRLNAALEGGRRIDERIVTDLERLAELRRSMDDQLGGGALYESVTADLRLITQLLANTSYPEALGRRMYGVAAELARLAGYACHDNGHEGAAQRFWLVALRAAHQAQDKPLGANVMTFMGVQALEICGANEAVTLFASAQHAGGTEIGATQRAAIASLAACAHAKAADSSSAGRSIDEAFTWLDQSQPTDDPSWIYWADMAELSGNAGSALLRLGENTRALPHLQAATDSLRPSSSRDRVLWMSTLASAHLRAGNADQALATAHQAIDITARLSSDRMRHLLGDFCREATGTLGNPASAALVEHARTTVKL
ncbi:tetratricopeptide repeat protein [Amycolatopsis sp. NPDC059021]|uniref:tetratricopeptide repeat protein n=1 Tax=Amycolatopsis sp. NPDC059021 TaxID=3346704 RepID=UPI00366D1986